MGRFRNIGKTKKIKLAGFGHQAMLLGSLEGIGQLRQVLGAIWVKTIQSAPTNHRFKHPAIGLAGVDSATQILEVAKGAAAFPLIENFTDGTLAHALDGPQSVLNAVI